MCDNLELHKRVDDSFKVLDRAFERLLAVLEAKIGENINTANYNTKCQSPTGGRPGK